MLENPIERRHMSDRRGSCGGGRRMTDLPSRPSDSPTCPACREPGAALLAGESDGGWWFVCLACDHLWDQRHTTIEQIRADDAAMTVEVRAYRYERGASFWRRLSFRRAHG